MMPWPTWKTKRVRLARDLWNMPGYIHSQPMSKAYYKGQKRRMKMIKAGITKQHRLELGGYQGGSDDSDISEVCPALRGVNWGPCGELSCFSNFLALSDGAEDADLDADETKGDESGLAGMSEEDDSAVGVESLDNYADLLEMVSKLRNSCARVGLCLVKRRGSRRGTWNRRQRRRRDPVRY